DPGEDLADDGRLADPGQHPREDEARRDDREEGEEDAGEDVRGRGRHRPSALRSASALRPTSTTISGSRSTSGSVVRKLTMQARSRNAPSSTAFETNASPASLIRVRISSLRALRYGSSAGSPGVRPGGT